MPSHAARLLALSGLICVLLAPLGGGRPAQAAATGWLDHDHAQLRLLAASDSVGPQETLRLGLHFKLQPGWKIYWRSPGDAGYPPALDWQGSANLAGAEIRWPVPHRFSLFGLQTFGYGDEVVLPIAARLERPGAPVALRAAVSYLVCSDICVPHDGTLSLDLPAGTGTPVLHASLIDQAETLVPGLGAEAGLSLERAFLTGDTKEPELEATARSDIPFEAPDLLVEAPPGYIFGKPKVHLQDGGRRAEFKLAAARGTLAEGVLEGKRLTLTVTDGRRGLESEVIARYESLPPMAAMTGGSLLVMLGLALLGGLILNLMPCVLPVLSIKLLSAISHGGRARGAIRVSFLASAAGILFSFLVLAGAALALKAAGMAVGWGIQFQQPLFLSAMALVVTLFACNLLGWFEIPLPAWLGGLGEAGAGGGQGGGHGLAGHFLTGAFATVLATPCSAPFLGTAVGFALARGAAEILLIFAVLGLGLALPYLAVAAFPGLAGRLPRPGPWMVVLRRILGLALAGTALWLLSVLAAQVGVAAAVLAGVLLLAVGLLLFLGDRLRGPVLAASVSALALAAVALPSGFGATARPEPAPGAATAGDWRPLDPPEIARLVAAGKVVFVDVTADWCLTCQVNKKLVLEDDDVAERLGAAPVVAMRGDWTLPSDEITDYLTGFGRYGIPFNVVFGPGAPEGRLLPELLTVETVLEALDAAAGG
jgi:suppressor for copper-sensitivity B